MDELLKESTQLLAEYESASKLLYQRKRAKYLADIKTDSELLSDGPQSQPWIDIATQDGQRRGSLITDAEAVFTEAEDMQKKELAKKVHDATAFLGSQTEVASSLHSTIR